MSDNPESGNAEDQNGSANRSDSQQSDSQPSGGLDVDALVKAVLDHPDFQKQTQSVKDKRIAQIQTDLEEQGEGFTRLASALGISQDDLKKAQTQIAVEDMVHAYQSGNLNLPANQATDQPPQASGVDLSKVSRSILNQAGLEEAPPGFDQHLATLDWSDPIEAALSAGAWVNEQKAGTRQSSPAGKAPPPSNRSATDLEGMTSDELGTKLMELQKNPAQTTKERAEIIAILERRGE